MWRSTGAAPDFALTPAPTPRRASPPEVAPELHRSVQRLLRELSCAPVLTGGWPDTLRALVDVTEAVLRAHPDPDPWHRAQRVVLAIAAYVGGGKLHAPPAALIERALRDARIWSDHQKRPRDTLHLAEKYGLSPNQIYVILRVQAALRRRPLPERFS